MSLSLTFSALSDPHRQKILEQLRKEEATPTSLAEGLDITMATLSHHLDILKRAGLVSSRREGRQIVYFLNLSVSEEIVEAAIKFLKGMQQ